jgi:N-acetylglutamate synthase-like GNAT family acetyltransferase
MEKIIYLRDGTEVTLRNLKEDDIDQSFDFFKALSESDRLYLRVDVTQKELVGKRIKDMRRNNISRIIALTSGKIIADGALEQEDHIGELRLIVANDYRRKGLGMLMANELYSLAAKKGIDEIVVKIMKPQKDAQCIFHRLGFHHDVILPSSVYDINHHKQDLIIMRCQLKELWTELADYFYEKDMRRMVTHMF